MYVVTIHVYVMACRLGHRNGQSDNTLRSTPPAHTCDSLTVKTESSKGHQASRHMNFVVSFSTGARLSVHNVLLCQALDVVIHPSAPCFEGSPHLLNASPDQQEILQGLRGQQVFGQFWGNTVAHGP